MFPRTILPGAPALYALFIALPPSLCHMQLSWPNSLRSKWNPSTPDNIIDYSLTSPLHPSGSNYPCKGYQADLYQEPAATYTAGSTYNVTFAGTAKHLGGSCQLSLSYDQEQTFRVIKSVIGGCPIQTTYDFTVPQYAPSGEAIFAWSWQNKIGNREFYMDCAVVQVVSEESTQQKRQSSPESIDSLPGIWKANLQSINDCVTVEGENPVYPNPGLDVEYGDGMDSSSTPSLGECDAIVATPETADPSSTDPYTSYMPVDDAAQAGVAATSPENHETDHTSHDDVAAEHTSTGSEIVGDSFTPLNINKGVDHAPNDDSNSPQELEDIPSQANEAMPDTTSPAALNRIAPESTPARSTTTITIDCPDVITLTIYPTETPPPIYTTSAPPSACTGTSAACPCAPGYDCRSIGTCTWACIAQSQPSTSSGFRTTTVPTSSARIITTRTTTIIPPPSTRPTPPSDRPPYVSASEIQSYLPCVPGSFICTSPTEWYTCDYNGATDPSRSSTSYVYTAPRRAADGMECLPFLVPYSGADSQYAQQNKAPQGQHRDDRYVRARPDGDCARDGELQCVDEGRGFMVCDQGGWVRMGAVADGTVCRGGAIVGA